MNSRVCVHKFVDDGCITGTSIAISPTQQYLACGSSSGVVNLYNTNQLENNSLPKPDKGTSPKILRKFSHEIEFYTAFQWYWIWWRRYPALTFTLVLSLFPYFPLKEKMPSDWHTFRQWRFSRIFHYRLKVLLVSARWTSLLMEVIWRQDSTTDPLIFID